MSRHYVSVRGLTYTAICAYAERHGMSPRDVVEAMIERYAVTGNGRHSTADAHGDSPTPARAHLPEPARIQTDAAWCAICADTAETYYLEPLGKDGAHVAACSSCCDAHPRSGRYSFEGGKANATLSPGGDGNKRTPRRATGAR